MKAGTDSDGFAVLALRYFDGSAGAPEVSLLEQQLKDSPERRSEYLELGRMAAILSDHYRMDALVSRERHFDRERFLTPALQPALMAAAAAAIIALLLSGWLVWAATEPQPLEIAGLGPSALFLESAERSWNPATPEAAALIYDVGYGSDWIKAATLLEQELDLSVSVDVDVDVDAISPAALRLAGNLEFDFVPFDFSEREESDPFAWIHSPALLF